MNTYTVVYYILQTLYGIDSTVQNIVQYNGHS